MNYEEVKHLQKIISAKTKALEDARDSWKALYDKTARQLEESENTVVLLEGELAKLRTELGLKAIEFNRYVTNLRKEEVNEDTV